jgi:hypothetical protein
MTDIPLIMNEDYWQNLDIGQSDLDFVTNYLFELESPLTTDEILKALIDQRLLVEKQALEEKRTKGKLVYTPKDNYQTGDELTFPQFAWQHGKVTSVRAGINPDISSFSVLEVLMDSGETKSIASNLDEHKLNTTVFPVVDETLNAGAIIEKHQDSLRRNLEEALSVDDNLVKIARHWFPRALLVDVNIGHLNLAEAVLDMAGGGPLSTRSLLEQIELPTDSNAKLTEFSFNLAMQEDGRFDEVGPSGEVLWFLKRLEPADVQSTPVYLKYNRPAAEFAELSDEMSALKRELADELSSDDSPAKPETEVSISLIYPHWRAGTLPLSARIRKIIPTAYESPRVKFEFCDENTGKYTSAWVVRASGYVYGLRDWYLSQGVIPGSMITIRKGTKPGTVMVRVDNHKPTREWMRTILVGADGGVVLALLKQSIATTYDERMVVMVPDTEAIDRLWNQTGKAQLETVIRNMTVELGKLNPQGHVHLQELYAVVNVLRRCPPEQIYSILTNDPAYTHVGDLYFRLNDSINEE